MQQNKSISTEKFLHRTFVIFSIVAVLVFYLTMIVFSKSYDLFIEKDAKSYFANTNFDKSSSEKVISAGGWILLTDNNMQIIDSYGFDFGESDCINYNDIIALINQELKINGITYSGTFSRYENDQFLIIALPSEHIKITYTLVNLVSPTFINFLLIFLFVITLFVIGYLLDIYFMSTVVKKKTVTPILEILNALKEIKENNYDVKINCKVDNEFMFIVEAINEMINRLKTASDVQLNQQKEKMRTLSDVGHDLRTPLTVIQGSLNAILTQNIKQDDRNKFLESAYETVRHMSSLINYQLDYALTDKEIQPTTKICNLSEILRKTIISYYGICEMTEKKLEINIPDNDIYLNANCAQLTRVLNNLISNAIFHNPAYTNILVSLMQKNDYIEIIVADTGKYIPLKEFNESKKQDYKLKKINKEIHGLGLINTRKIINQYDGQFTLDTNTENYIKAFIIRFPIMK